MSTERVLQIPRSDVKNAFILVHVSGQGPPNANLTLLATEDTNPYVANIRQKQLASLRARTYRGDEQEWLAIFSWAFLRQKPSEGVSNFVREVELVSAVHDEREIVLTLRHMVSGISQKLGAIVLECDDTQKIDLFIWAGTAAQSSIDVEKEVLDLESRMEIQQQTLDKLNSQLQDLIKSKKQQEDELLEKFRRLLNSKKLKIRDQLRLLSTAKVDPQVANQIRQARSHSETAPTPKTKPRKRKAQAMSPPPEAEEEEGEEEEPQLADEDTKLGDSSSDEEGFTRGASPDRTDSEATDDESNNVEPALAYRNRGKAADDDDDDDDDDEEMPPRRELPFAKPKAQAPAAKAGGEDEEMPPKRELPFPNPKAQVQAAKAVEDDEETDDEL